MDGDGGAGGATQLQHLAQHGGRLCSARELYPHAPEPWIDLSTGINPYSYPAPRSSAAQRARLPDPQQLAALEQLAATAMGVSEPERVIALGGTELALRLLPIALDRKAAIIAGPTYSSHADAWRRAGAEVYDAFNDPPRPTGHAAVILVNPNNPDGRLFTREQCLELHDAARAREGVLIIDEAFTEVAPGHSVSDLAGSARAPDLITLRSFGKFYGLAGVRLGFVIGAPALVMQLRGLIGDWPLSADALSAGLAAYRDTTWAQRMRERLRRTAARLDALLERSGFVIVGGTSLFRLARHPAAASRLHVLLRAGILVRPFEHDASVLRFGLPRGAPSWQRLARALS